MRTVTSRYFANELFLGLVSRVNTYNCFVKIPKPNLLKSVYFEGQEYCGGVVGRYVTVCSENFAYLAIIQDISIPKENKYSIEEIENENLDSYKTDFKIQLLLSFQYSSIQKSSKITSNNGIKEFPIVGSKIYICHNELLGKILGGLQQDVPSLNLGQVNNGSIELNIPIASLFERHCAVVGTTGGGKSCTIGKMVQEIVRHNEEKPANKLRLILFDATGEFEGLKDKNIKQYKFGTECEQSVHFSYKNLTIFDLFTLFEPSANIQATKLREAIKSLKLNQARGEKNTYTKEGSKIKDFNDLCQQYEDNIYSENSLFNIKLLANQIHKECIYPTGKKVENNRSISDPTIYGGQSEQDLGWCSPLINKISYKVRNKNYNQIFNFQDNQSGSKDIISALEDDFEVANISLKDVPFDDNVRQILMNCVGRFLLAKARQGDFRQNPVVIFLDEAHQFLNYEIKGEYAPDMPLDAFDNIAKECRKHGLYLCLSTQMPRDIPSGTLSQVGTFIVHRLINEDDKNKVRNACQESTREILSYLPALGQGECIIVSNYLPMPLHAKVDLPNEAFQPNSKSPLGEHMKKIAKEESESLPF